MEGDVAERVLSLCRNTRASSSLKNVRPRCTRSTLFPVDLRPRSVPQIHSQSHLNFFNLLRGVFRCSKAHTQLSCTSFTSLSLGLTVCTSLPFVRQPRTSIKTVCTSAFTGSPSTLRCASYRGCSRQKQQKKRRKDLLLSVSISVSRFAPV